MSPDKVLLVDDEHDFVETLAKRMKARGLTVETAESGEEALELVTAQSFDAIVLDLAMPGMDGLETLRELLSRDDTLQVILLTGHGSVQKGVEAMKAGAADFLEKPADIQDLMEKIRKASAQKLVLVQERHEHDVEDILRKKGW